MRTDHDVVVVGSGFSGIGMAIKLKEAGIERFVILERASEIGGTWRDNTYPGCACDVQSHLYSFSFEPNPRWSRKYAPWREIQDHLLHVVQKNDLRRHMRFNKRLTEAHFDATRGQWRIETADGEALTSRVLISGQGGLSNPFTPEIPGLHAFQGKTFHSAQWDHDFDPAGKRIAAIGTGASAIQFVPELAKTAAKLHVFQRTPPWILPRPDRAFAEWEKQLFERLPMYRKAYRTSLYVWGEIAANALLRPQSAFARLAAKWCNEHLEMAVPDPVLRAKLTPDYQVGCKRILLGSNYYPVLQQANVELVTDEIAEIDAHGIRTRDGAYHKVDAIVFGTGFRVSEPLYQMNVFGLDGRNLNQVWERNGLEAYLGTTVAGFPNFFMLAGPNTGQGHTSLLYMVESQFPYIVQGVQRVLRGKTRYVDVKEQVQQAFSTKLQEKLQGTVWLSGCNSWYLNHANKNYTIWPDFTFKYRWRTARVAWGDYHIVKDAPQEAQEPTAIPDAAE